MTDHRDRIERVRAHLAQNLDGDLSLDALAEVAAMSRFHWHRVYRAATGETVHDTVRRERLNRAALLVATTRQPMGQVARACGFADPDALSRAFRASFGLTPRSVRSRGLPAAALLPPRVRPDARETPMPPVAIRTEDPVELAALPHRGPYPEIDRVFAELIPRLRAAGVAPVGAAHAFCYDDPHATPPEQLRSHAAMPIAPGTPLPPDLERLRTGGGRVAVALHRGSYAGLPEAWDDTYRWLAQSGEAAREEPPFERYLDDPSDTPEAGLRTEIVVPPRP